MRRLLIALPIALLVLAVAAGAGYYAVSSSNAPTRTVAAADITLEDPPGAVPANSPLLAEPKTQAEQPAPEPKPASTPDTPVESPKPVTDDDKMKATLAELEEKLKASGLNELDPAQLEEIRKKVTEKLLEAAKYQVTLKGTVVDHTGAAVAGANVMVGVSTQSRRGKSFSMRMLADTDESGNFSGTYLKSAAEGAAFELAIYARSADAPESEHQLMMVTPGETYDGIKITLPQGAGITGRVVDANFNPIFNARVQAATADRKTGSDGMRPSAVTDADGRFTLKGMSEGTYMLSVTAAGYELAGTWPTASVTSGEPTALAADIVMKMQAALTFRLTCADGIPAGSFSVEFFLKDGKTSRGAGWADKDGNAMITVLLLEATEMRITKRGYLVTERIAISPMEGQHVDLGEVALQADPDAKKYPKRGETDGSDIEEKLKKLEELRSKLPAKD